MRDLPAELWVFFLTAVLAVGLLVTAVVAAIIISQRKLSSAARAFAAREVRATEEERSRVARELHDDVSQQVAILNQRIELMRDAAERGAPPPDVMATVDDVGEGLRRIATSVRGIAHRMHPSSLDLLGLRAALEELARETRAVAPFEIHVAVAPDAERLPRELALGFYRIAQEALRNIQKHAAAGRVALGLVVQQGQAVMEVTDDGVGFAPAHGGPGLGVSSMQERARLLGGYTVVSSMPGNGTTVRVTLPVAPDPG